MTDTRSLRVLLDATSMPKNRGGVGRYLDELVPALLTQGIDLTIVCQLHDVAVFTKMVPDATVVAAPTWIRRRPLRLFWEQTGLPLLARKLRVQLLHSPHYTMPVFSPVPVVVTAHDMTFFSDPQVHLPVKARFFRQAIRFAGRRAAAVVVPSGATGQEMAKYVAVRPPLVVAHHGVDSDFYQPVSSTAQQRVRESLNLGDRPYVAFLGTLEPRKNLSALVQGWAAAVGSRPEPRPALVLAGGRGWDESLDEVIAGLDPELVCLLPGYLPLEDLPAFLAAATIVAYPSLGEGFGLPVLEAMACGAPVLTTRRLALPEVGGDAVQYCDVDAKSISSALKGLLDDPDLLDRLGAAARVRALTFTWEAAAQRHVEAYYLAVGLQHL